MPDLVPALHELALSMARLSAAIEGLLTAHTGPSQDVPRGAEHERVAAESLDALAQCRLRGLPTP